MICRWLVVGDDVVIVKQYLESHRFLSQKAALPNLLSPVGTVYKLHWSNFHFEGCKCSRIKIRMFVGLEIMRN